MLLSSVIEKLGWSIGGKSMLVEAVRSVIRVSSCWGFGGETPDVFWVSIGPSSSSLNFFVKRWLGTWDGGRLGCSLEIES
jgi:hypothetical protein